MIGAMKIPSHIDPALCLTPLRALGDLSNFKTSSLLGENERTIKREPAPAAVPEIIIQGVRLSKTPDYPSTG